MKLFNLMHKRREKNSEERAMKAKLIAEKANEIINLIGERKCPPEEYERNPQDYYEEDYQGLSIRRGKRLWPYDTWERFRYPIVQDDYILIDIRERENNKRVFLYDLTSAQEDRYFFSMKEGKWEKDLNKFYNEVKEIRKSIQLL